MGQRKDKDDGANRVEARFLKWTHETLGHTVKKDGNGELMVRNKFYPMAMPSKVERLGEPYKKRSFRVHLYIANFNSLKFSPLILLDALYISTLKLLPVS